MPNTHRCQMGGGPLSVTIVVYRRFLGHGGRGVGRGKELAALDSFIAAARAGFALLAIEGEPGIGKTTLWRHGVRRAVEQGATVLTARATEAEGGLSLAAIGDLFDPLGDDTLEQLPDPQRRALSTALLRSSPPAEGIDERALAASVLRILSVDRPVVARCLVSTVQLPTRSGGRMCIWVRLASPPPAGAAELVELALELTPAGQDDRRLTRLIAAGRFWFDAGDLGRSEEALGSALTGAPEGALRAEALRLISPLRPSRPT